MSRDERFEASKIWPSIRIPDILYRMALLVLLAALGWNVFAFASYALDAISYPYELDYGEGTVWRQMAALASSEMYSDFNAYPYLVFHYTPIYHGVTFLTSEVLGNPLATGRIVSLLASLGYAALIGFVVHQAVAPETPRWTRMAGSLGAPLVLFTFMPVFSWAPLMHVDMLALFFEMAGIALFLLSLKRPRLFYVAAIVFVLAVYTKQSFISGAFACFAVSLALRPGLTIRALALAVVLGGGVLIGFSIATGGEFTRHIFQYNINRVQWVNVSVLVRFLDRHFIMLVIAGVGVLLVAIRFGARQTAKGPRALRVTVRDQPDAAARLTALIYLSVTAFLTLGILKSGASINYLIPLAGACTIMFGLFTVELLSITTAGNVRSKVMASVVCLMSVWQVYANSAYWEHLPSPERQRAAQQVVDKIRHLSGPIWSEEMTLTMLAGKNAIAESAIVTDLAIQGVWDQGPFLDLFRTRTFDVVVIKSLQQFERLAHGQQEHPTRFTPELRAAIADSYPVVEAIGEYRLYYPPPPGPHGVAARFHHTNSQKRP